MFLEPILRFRAREHERCPVFVEGDRRFQLRGPNGGIDLRGVNPRVTEKGSDLLQVLPFAQDLGSHAVSQVMGLQSGVPDLGSVHIA